MRYRNVKVPATTSGAIRPSLLGRDVRSRLFVPMDSGRQFAQVELGDRYPTLRTVGADGQDVVTSIQAAIDDPAEWHWDERPPVPQLPDSRPPDSGPVDNRPGGVDRPSTSDIGPTRKYAVSGSSVSRSLNVSTPTVANCAQVLNALLQDLSAQRVVSR